MNELFFLNFPNLINFMSDLTSNISFYYDRFVSLRFVNIIIEINNLFITYVIIFCFSFGHVRAVVIMIVW